MPPSDATIVYPVVGIGSTDRWFDALARVNGVAVVVSLRAAAIVSVPVGVDPDRPIAQSSWRVLVAVSGTATALLTSVLPLAVNVNVDVVGNPAGGVPS